MLWKPVLAVAEKAICKSSPTDRVLDIYQEWCDKRSCDWNLGGQRRWRYRCNPRRSSWNYNRCRERGNQRFGDCGCLFCYRNVRLG